SDVVSGLELGAEDYVTKPFSPKVLISRIRTVLRRGPVAAEQESGVIVHKDLTLHSGRHEVLVQNQPVDLTFTEFGILRTLVRRPGWVFTRSQIVDAVRGDNYAVTDRSVDFQIVGLRRKLGPCADYIQTVRGVGYRFQD
ncbi:MAG: response regulator transcription factor, partial [Nitrospinaceae bacterium]